MRINLTATDVRGGVPAFGTEAQVERDTHGIYINVPQTAGVVDTKSAVEFGNALLNAAGVVPAAPAKAGLPAGCYVESNGDASGWTLFDRNGTALGTFEEQVRYAFFPAV